MVNSPDAKPKLNTRLKFATFYKATDHLQTQKLGERYRSWIFAAKAKGLADIEQIVPYYDIPLAPPVSEGWAAENGNEQSAQGLLDAYSPKEWGYHMALSAERGTMGLLRDLRGTLALAKRRADYRLNLIFSGIEAVTGGTLAGKSVLDIACNWGGFSIEAALRGADTVVGFDIRDGNVAKARALLAHYGLSNVEFRREDLFDVSDQKTFDVVLNLGLMYHVTQPVEMMKRTYTLTNDVAVIDTIVHREAVSGFILGTGEAPKDHAATAVGMELHPSYRALVDLAYMVGFREVIEVHGTPSPEWQKWETEPYGKKVRRCIICRK